MTIPIVNVNEVRNAVCDAGAGVIGGYSYYSTSFKGIGTFRPESNANPYMGKLGEIEFVEEEKLEEICDVKNVKSVIGTLRKSNPYEEPAIDIIPLIDESYFD